MSKSISMKNRVRRFEWGRVEIRVYDQVSGLVVRRAVNRIEIRVGGHVWERVWRYVRGHHVWDLYND